MDNLQGLYKSRYYCVLMPSPSYHNFAAIIGIPAGLITICVFFLVDLDVIIDKKTDSAQTHPAPPQVHHETGNTIPNNSSYDSNIDTSTNHAEDTDSKRFLSNINPESIAPGEVAVYINADRTLASLLESGLEARGVSVSRGFFRRNFGNSGYFEDMLGGDGSLLARSRVLPDEARVFVGEAKVGYRRGEYELTVCDLSLTYAVLDEHGRAVAGRTFSAGGAAYDRTTALQDAVDDLFNQIGDTIASDLRR